MRIGNGFDVHRLVFGPPLILGGIRIPFEQGLEGYSDADVLSHAITDALLGAAALGDMGVWFPTNKPEWENADSIEMMKVVVSALKTQNYKIINIDSVIICERPKLATYFPKMRESIAKVAEINLDCVSVKATTNEGLGFIGRGEAIAAQAVVLIDKA